MSFPTNLGYRLTRIHKNHSKHDDQNYEDTIWKNDKNEIIGLRSYYYIDKILWAYSSDNKNEDFETEDEEQFINLITRKSRIKDLLQ